MDFGNFKDIYFQLFFVSMVVLVGTLILITFLFIVYVKRNKEYRELIDGESSSTLIFIIDIKQNKITYFNKSDMRNKVTSDLMSFYSRFHPNDVEEVKGWIFSICVDPKTTEQYLEADVLINSKKPCFSLLKLLKYDPSIGLIHIESRILRYITPNNAPKVKNGKKIKTGIIKRSEIAQMVNKSKSLRGFTYGFRFFYAKQKILSNNKVERHMLMTLKNVIYPFASSPRVSRQILDDGGNELFLFDLKLSNKEAAMQLATSIERALKKEIEVNGFVNFISFSIGVVENGQYYQDFDTIIENCREACISGQTNDNPVVLHQRNINSQSEMIKYNEQVDHILKHDVLRYLFRPIIDAKTADIIGYFEYVKAYDSPFSDFQEMSRYAARVNKNLDLFASIAKRVIPKFVSETRDNRVSLFLSVSMVDVEHVVEVIHNIPSSAVIKIIFVLDEQEVNENAQDVSLLVETLKSLIDQDFQIALSLHDKDLLLDDRVYSLFDYFIVGSSMLGTIRKNNHVRLTTYSLIESLLKYNKPIIATDLENWEAVELIIKSGINFISGDALVASSDMIIPLEKKKAKKITDMAEIYL